MLISCVLFHSQVWYNYKYFDTHTENVGKFVPHSELYSPFSDTKCSMHILRNLPVGVPIFHWSTTIAVRNVSYQWNRYNNLIPTLSRGSYLVLAAIVEAILDLSDKYFIAWNMITLHSFTERVHAHKGYFIIAEILECNACHDSWCETFPIITCVPHSITDF